MKASGSKVLFCSCDTASVRLLSIFRQPATHQFILLNIILEYNLQNLKLCRGEGNGTPLQYSCLEKSHGRRSLVGCSPWGREKSDTTSLSLSLFTFMHWRRKWQPTPVFLPRESQGWGSLVGCRLWGHTESDMTEAT